MEKKLFLTYVAIIIFLSALIGFCSINVVQGNYMAAFQESFTKEAKMLSDLFQARNTEWTQAYFKQFAEEYAKQLGYRITLIDENGTVLADSDMDVMLMENHIERKEVQQAQSEGMSTEIRYSSTLKTKLLYCAIPVRHGDRTIVMRLSVKLYTIEAIKVRILGYMGVGIAVAAGLAFLLAAYFADRITRPLTMLTEGAREIADGNYGKIIHVASKDSSDQIDVMTKAFNVMSTKLSATMEEIKSDRLKREMVVNSMLDALVAVDRKGHIMMINSVCYDLFRIRAENVIGYNFYDVVRNEAIYALLDKTYNSYTNITEELKFGTRKDGEKILRVYANPILGGAAGVLLVIQDITRIRKLEQLRSDFISNVTHELKTPLTSIMGFTDTLRQGAVNDLQMAMHFLDIIDVESQRLYRLIMDILSLSEIETMQKDDNMQPEEIGELLGEIISLLQPQAEKKKIDLQLQLQEEPVYLYCNRDRVKQMFVNLIDNGIKYTEEGYVRVAYHCDGKILTAQVIDTGIGIAEHARERIFERFYRVDKGRSRKAGGTGLGLSIVKHIILLYQGSINVEENQGRGTKFIIQIPLKYQSANL